jgi:putative spermidine/putrescine transport system permease protein
MNWKGIFDPTRLFLNIVFVGMLIFLFLPLVVVVPISFTPGTALRFPPEGLSWRWYEDFWNDERWRAAGWLSIRLAVSTAICATFIGMLAAIGLTRFVTKGKAILRAIVLAPLIVPLIITSVGIYYVMVRFELNATFWGMLIGHTVLALPYSIIIIESALRNYDIALEEAAMSLGASRVLAFRKITIPIILPAILASAVFGFITSWDEVLLVIFLGGPNAQTLPLRMFEFLSTQVRPTIAAISSVLIVTLLGVVVIYQLLSWQQRRTRGGGRPVFEPEEGGA